MGESSMKENHHWLKQMAKLGLLLLTGASMSADAGLFGFGDVSWKEEVLLHDGQKIVVKRSQSYGGRHEIGQGGSIKDQELTFTLPNTNKTLTFKDEFDENIGGKNFLLMALHIANGTPYIVAQPWACLSENKWGRPSPPYVFFKHDGKAWQRIPVSELPSEFKNINLSLSTVTNEAMITSQPIVTVELVKKLNGDSKTIQRDAVRYEGPGSCGEMIFGGKDSGWHGVGLFGKTYEACMQYCKRERVGPQYCPCETIFKGRK
jgi:hypothetical protein